MEALADDKLRTKGFIHVAVQDSRWKSYTNVPVSLLQSFQDAEEKEQAKLGIAKHRAAMACLA